MFKFLPGILLIQITTASLIYIGLKWQDDPQVIILMVAFSTIIAVLSSFWFASIVQHMHSSAKADLQQQHARDREKLLLKAEREKAKATSKSYQHIEKATKNMHAKANFKVGAAVAVAIGAGTIMILSQLITVGAMMLVASGSGLAGYLMRMKQENQESDIKSLPAKKKQSTKPRLTSPTKMLVQKKEL